MQALKNVWGRLLGIAMMVALGGVAAILISRMARTPADIAAAAAHRGDAAAQYQLALMYLNGDGVPQNNISAHMWFNLSAPQIGVIAGSYRGLVEQSMTREEIARAQEMAITCQRSKYKQCGELESTRSVSLQRQDGIYVVPVRINDTITLDFIVDSGAADVIIPADVVRTLIRTGAINTTDF
jgi:hypothetical protein